MHKETKYKTKTGMYHTIDKKIMEEFIELAKIKSINRSQLIEHYISDWIKKNK
jgi:hypothetical protein